MNKQRLEDELRKKEYLIGKSFRYAKFEARFPNDHTFCVFCWARISAWEEDLHDGYFEEDSKSWVCDICIEEFEKTFEWVVNKETNTAWERLMKKNAFDIPLV